MGPTLANISDESDVVDYIFPYRKENSKKKAVVESVNAGMIQEIAEENPALALQKIEDELTRVDHLRDTFEDYSDELFFQYTYLLRESKETEADYLLLAMKEKNQDRYPRFTYDDMSRVGKSLKGQRFTMSNVLQEYVDTRDSFREGKNNYISLIQIRALLTQETEGEKLLNLEPNTTIRVEPLKAPKAITEKATVKETPPIKSPYRDTKFDEVAPDLGSKRIGQMERILATLELKYPRPDEPSSE